MIRTHIDRLPEFYEQKYEDLDWDWIKALLVRKKVLVIDDEVNIRDTYSRILFNNGFDVLTASNAMDANEILKRERIDIILLDINMPEVDGAVLIELIRSFHKNIKVIVSSVYPIDEQKEKIQDADAYFDKSVGIDVLMEIVSSLLDRHYLPTDSLDQGLNSEEE